jgi:p-hydroxybenzoate 3-monooxygenase
MTSMLHHLDGDAFSYQLQLAELRYVTSSEAAARMLAENYVGLPSEHFAPHANGYQKVRERT